jgi:hypothetical protein
MLAELKRTKPVIIRERRMRRATLADLERHLLICLDLRESLLASLGRPLLPGEVAIFKWIRIQLDSPRVQREMQRLPTAALDRWFRLVRDYETAMARQ